MSLELKLAQLVMFLFLSNNSGAMFYASFYHLPLRWLKTLNKILVELIKGIFYSFYPSNSQYMLSSLYANVSTVICRTLPSNSKLCTITEIRQINILFVYLQIIHIGCKLNLIICVSFSKIVNKSSLFLIKVI